MHLNVCIQVDLLFYVTLRDLTDFSSAVIAKSSFVFEISFRASLQLQKEKLVLLFLSLLITQTVFIQFDYILLY